MAPIFMDVRNISADQHGLILVKFIQTRTSFLLLVEPVLVCGCKKILPTISLVTPYVFHKKI
jgi:hypothetical protein